MSSLFEYGEGILKTHLTWEDLQQEIFDVFGESAVLGPNKSATSIGDGRGFLSKMCLIEPDWKEQTTAPNKLVVKICCQLAITEAIKAHENAKGKSAELDSFMNSWGALSEAVRTTHNHEAEVYNLIRKYNISGIPVPKVYKAVKFTDDCKLKGFLIMEYIEEALNLNICDNIGVEEAKQVLRGIAALEAASLKFSDEEKSSIPSWASKQLSQNMLDPKTAAATARMLKEFSKSELHPKIEQMEEILPELTDLSLFDIGPELGMTPVLVHGDVWSANILWRKSETGNLDLAVVVDFQGAHFGMPAADILRLLCSSMSGKERQKNWEKLSEYFYKELLQELKESPAPYTLKQLKENCRRFYPMAGALLVPTLGHILQMHQQNPDDETKRKIVDTINEKLECLIDDMIFYHERNQQMKKSDE